MVETVTNKIITNAVKCSENSVTQGYHGSLEEKSPTKSASMG